MKGNLHVRFLEEGEGAISPSYSAISHEKHLIATSTGRITYTTLTTRYFNNTPEFKKKPCIKAHSI
jgi:hypothetical protein